MSKINMIECDSGECFDIVIEVDFQQKIDVMLKANLFQIIGDAMSIPAFRRLFQGLIDFEIGLAPQTLRLRFRYLTWHAKEMGNISEAIKEYIGNRRMNFISYLIALVDKNIHVVDPPFLPNFREWLDLPIQIENDGIL